MQIAHRIFHENGMDEKWVKVRDVGCIETP